MYSNLKSNYPISVWTSKLAMYLKSNYEIISEFYSMEMLA